MGNRNLTDTVISPQRGGSDSTVARTCQATGEALLAPRRNHRSRVDRITGSTGREGKPLLGVERPPCLECGDFVIRPGTDFLNFRPPYAERRIVFQPSYLDGVADQN